MPGRDMRRSDVIETFAGGGDARANSETFGNSIERSSFLFKAYRLEGPSASELDLDSKFCSGIRNPPPRPTAKRLKILERVKGIEPSYSAWKAAALPLSYTRDFNNFKS
jgi:hypothetical protein